MYYDDDGEQNNKQQNEENEALVRKEPTCLSPPVRVPVARRVYRTHAYGKA